MAEAAVAEAAVGATAMEVATMEAAVVEEAVVEEAAVASNNAKVKCESEQTTSRLKSLNLLTQSNTKLCFSRQEELEKRTKLTQ